MREREREREKEREIERRRKKGKETYKDSKGKITLIKKSNFPISRGGI